MGPVESEPPPNWPTCTDKGCIGIQLPGEECCLAHVDPAVRKGFLENLRWGADIDLSGTPLATDLLNAMSERLGAGAVPLGRSIFTRALFIGDAGFPVTEFNDKADFFKAQFNGLAGFFGAQFNGSAVFASVQFAGRSAGFERAQFCGDAWFDTAQFSGNAAFDNAQFNKAYFNRAEFNGKADFSGAQFSEDAWFSRTQFNKDAVFDQARFGGPARFGEAQFMGAASFTETQFSDVAYFDGVRFSAARAVGPLIGENDLWLSQATFSAPILLELAASRLGLVGAAFEESATLRLRFADIALDDASFSKPSTISYAETAFHGQSASEPTDHGLETGKQEARPRALSLRGVDVSNLVLGNLDLSACLFQGAHNLEKLRIEGPLRLNKTPTAWWRVRLGRWWIPVWCWTPRQALAEEHLFRMQRSSWPTGRIASRLRKPAWDPPDTETLKWVGDATRQPIQSLGAENLAALYRALRKGLEDQKNAPAAADFYYGEMEMRRICATSLADRFVLWVYWLFSGYGLRAGRALLALALVVPLFAIGYWLGGLNPYVSYQIALLRSFQSATSLLRDPPPGLTPIGQLLDAVLRLIGATLLGLALFSLRGRIQR